MFRRIFLAFLIFIASTSTVWAQAYGQSGGLITMSDDRWTHWPWRLAQPFPWSDIQGTWRVEESDYVSYFVFKKFVQPNKKVLQIRVKQIDPNNCMVIASGVGIEKGGFIYAQMTSNTGNIFRLNLSAFKRSELPLPPQPEGSITDSVMVLSMGELSVENFDEMIHMQIVKVSSELNDKVCLQNKK